MLILAYLANTCPWLTPPTYSFQHINIFMLACKMITTNRGVGGEREGGREEDLAVSLLVVVYLAIPISHWYSSWSVAVYK